MRCLTEGKSINRKSFRHQNSFSTTSSHRPSEARTLTISTNLSDQTNTTFCCFDRLFTLIHHRSKWSKRIDVQPSIFSLFIPIWVARGPEPISYFGPEFTQIVNSSIIIREPAKKMAQPKQLMLLTTFNSHNTV